MVWIDKIAQAIYYYGYSQCKKALRHHGRSPDSDGKDIGKLEEKEELTPSDGKKIRRIKELAEQFDCEFEGHHVEVVDFIVAEDTAALESEEAVFDEHVDRVTEFIECLEQVEDLVGNYHR